MEPATWLLLGALGAWAALDGVAAGQFMVSRPLVTATVTGALLGDPWTGFILGLLLEVAHLGAVPSGGARLPEPGPAAIPAAALAVSLDGGGAGATLGVTLGMLLALAGGWAVIQQRRLNGRLVQGLDEGRLSLRQLNGRLAVSLASEGVRGAVIAVGGTVGALRLAPWLEAGWPLADDVTWAVLLALLAFPAGVLTRRLGGRRAHAVLLTLGGLVGLALGAWAVQ